MNPLPRPPVLVITDRKQTERPLLQVAAALLAGGCRWLSLREPDLRPGERVNLLYRLVNLGERAGATIGIHADYEAAMTTGAPSVHLPRHGSIKAARDYLGARALIGISAHDGNEVQRALALGADYVTLSPIFETASKPGYGPALGLKTLSDLCKALPIPVYALGGIDRGNAADCIAAGAAGVAIMGGAMRAADPEAMIRDVIAAIGGALVSARSASHSRL
ncbi:MAG TPA: thiamine phosphate synthase [Stellaceae bacterium]|jgi:thiamine-phosphate pyrophosphorylase|nr:thiamine phosphate synthase [Stellaceae bacterium]